VGPGGLGATRCARAGVIVVAQELDALGELLLFYGSIAVGINLRLALAIGSLGLLEDVDNVFALCW
jgi:hypothetical protein